VFANEAIEVAVLRLHHSPASGIAQAEGSFSRGSSRVHCAHIPAAVSSTALLRGGSLAEAADVAVYPFV